MNKKEKIGFIAMWIFAIGGIVLFLGLIFVAIVLAILNPKIFVDGLVISAIVFGPVILIFWMVFGSMLFVMLIRE